ncbi:phosphate uptake regulator PhoU [Candidatus Pacearchaeota archaeon]|nr:phosphate uptake regulator PhoU [Candidatus Pacearchaeota archaeon]
MTKTKRSIVLHGPSTLTISLPSQWVKKHNLKRGEELTVEELGKELKIYPEEIKNSEEKKLIEFGIGERVGKSSITGAYRQGYDIIEINFKNPNYIQIIQDIISKQMIGFEIIQQKEDSCIIKDLTGHTRDEFETVQRRIWLLILDLSEECLNALEKRNKKSMERVKFKDYTINKFTNYCLRHLLKIGHSNTKQTVLLYYSIKSLEEIADSYKRLCLFSKEEKFLEKEDLDLIKELNKELEFFYNIWYNYNRENMELLIDKITKIKEKIEYKQHRLFHLQTTTVKITDLASVRIQLELN